MNTPLVPAETLGCGCFYDSLGKLALPCARHKLSPDTDAQAQIETLTRELATLRKALETKFDEHVAYLRRRADAFSFQNTGVSSELRHQADAAEFLKQDLLKALASSPARR